MGEYVNNNKKQNSCTTRIFTFSIPISFLSSTEFFFCDNIQVSRMHKARLVWFGFSSCLQKKKENSMVGLVV